MRKLKKLQCMLETDREKEKGFAFVLLFFILLLGVFNIKKILLEERLSAMVLRDFARNAETFLCPWTCYDEHDGNSIEGTCEKFLSPYLELGEDLDGKLGKDSEGKVSGDSGKEALDLSEQEVWNLLERETLLVSEGEAADISKGGMLDDAEEKQGSRSREDLWDDEILAENHEKDLTGQGEENVPLLEQLPEGEKEVSGELVARYERRTSFQPHEKSVEINLEEIQSYENLVKRFYTIDPSTMAGSDQLNVKDLMEKDFTMEKGSEGPQILIYHTHSREAFCDSDPDDPKTSIVGMGEELANILREDYGYQVLHHVGAYDVPSRNEAYSRALPEIQRILEENPTIQVVIDLHRDEMPERTRLVTEIDGKKTAKFMFFNGLSRTKRTGNLDYLYNVYQQDNLAFSFQMEKAAQEYYPNLTRKIYLKGYRYNMHLMPRTLLIELGAQNNTVEEALNACGPLAHLLNIVLSGDE